jgi:hydrogenase expression/formation protein HypE
VGKVPVGLLRRLLARGQSRHDPSVLIGPGIGLDAAALRVGNTCLVVKSDPITFVSDEIGVYALTVNANDLATMGARPRWFLATVLLPAGTRAAQVSRLFVQLSASCRRLGVALVGGHSEITTAVTRPVVAGCLLGECSGKTLLTTTGARVGDAVLLTKGIPIEAVSILARERAAQIRKKFGAAFLARCRSFLEKPGLSVLRDAELALASGGVHAMHDPTEGGLSTALHELAEAAGVGLEIDAQAVTILPEGARVCAAFGIDPWGAIASGALLICVAPARTAALLTRLREAGIGAARIGTVRPRRHGVRVVRNGRSKRLPRFAADEIARVLGDGQRAKQP